MSIDTRGTIQLSAEALESFAKQLFDALLSIGCDRKEATLTRLGLEEALSICIAHGLNTMEYRLYRRASRVIVKMQLIGEPCNPLMGMQDVDIDDSLKEYLTRISTGLSYSYQNKANCLTCRLTKRRRLPAYVPTLIAVASALAFAYLMKLTPWSVAILDELITPLSTSYLRLLNTFSTPMIFLSVLCGVANLADIGTLDTLGKRLIKQLCLWGVFSGAVAVLASVLLQGNYAGFGGLASAWFPAARDMLLDMIPESLMGAFVANSTQSVLLIAILLAVVINRRREQLKRLPSLLNELGDVATEALTIVCKLLPAYVFLSVSKLVLSSSVGVMLSVGRIVGMFLAVWALLILLNVLLVALRYGKRAPAYLKGMLPGSLIALSTASGSSAMSQTMADCRDTLGLPKELTQVGVPVYTVMNKPFSCANIVVMVVTCAAIQGVSFNLVQCAALALMAFLFSVASPPVLNGTMVCFAMAFAQFGVGGDMLALAVAAHTINTFFTSGGNVFSVHAQLALLQKRQSE